jgi:hypothetical protein
MPWLIGDMVVELVVVVVMSVVVVVVVVVEVVVVVGIIVVGTKVGMVVAGAGVEPWLIWWAWLPQVSHENLQLPFI